jgi:organic hydroperoxide reductase OsmC/OhrA
LWTEAEGTVEAPERVMRVTSIRVTYHVTVPPGKRADAERALAAFERGCPVAQTLKGCVAITHAWDIREE